MWADREHASLRWAHYSCCCLRQKGPRLRCFLSVRNKCAYPCAVAALRTKQFMCLDRSALKRLAQLKEKIRLSIWSMRRNTFSYCAHINERHTSENRFSSLSHIQLPAARRDHFRPHRSQTVRHSPIQANPGEADKRFRTTTTTTGQHNFPADSTHFSTSLQL